MTFKDLEFHPDLQRGIDEAGFTECTPVQEQTFAHSLDAVDVLVQSQTGTGKTAAFLITIFELFLKDAFFDDKFALIVVPTRELAVQIEKEAQLLARFLDFSIGSVYGGVAYGEQERLLRDGAHVVIGTPGRLLDFTGSGKLKLSTVGALVIDEADRLFDMGFMPDVRRILRQVPPADKRWTMLASATLDTAARTLAWKEMNKPVEIEIRPERVTVDEVEQIIYHVPRERKLSLLLGILKRDQPSSCLIFTNTKSAAEEVCLRLRHNGYEAEFIIGDLPQRKRSQIMEGMKSGNVPILVATDVAARGLHINDLPLVVNYDIPEQSESYVHRIGRTARAGKTGRAIALACEQYVYGLAGIEQYTKIKIPVAAAEDSLYAPDSSARVGWRRLLAETGAQPVRPEGPRGSDRGPRQSSRSGGDRTGSRGPRRPQTRPSVPHGLGDGQQEGTPRRSSPPAQGERPQRERTRSERPQRERAQGERPRPDPAPGESPKRETRGERARRKRPQRQPTRERGAEGEQPQGERSPDRQEQLQQGGSGPPRRRPQSAQAEPPSAKPAARPPAPRQPGSPVPGATHEPEKSRGILAKALGLFRRKK